MNAPRSSLWLLSVCLMTGGGCDRKPARQNVPKPFTPEAQQLLAEAEKSPEASLELLNETLKDWLLRHPNFPKDLQEFVTARMLPRMPAAPPGKRFVMDVQQRRVVLADQ